MAADAHTLLVDRFQERTRVLGPGLRAVVWFHGCTRNCPGCVAAEMNASTDFQTCTPGELAERVRAVTDIEGLTISGGEPFQQNPVAMRSFLEQIRTHSSLSVMLYTGYRLGELRKDPERAHLLELLDILVDGPYREDLDHGELWRGSSNQHIHVLTPRYRAWGREMSGKYGRPLEVAFQDGLNFNFTGIPPRGFRNRVRKALAVRGFTVAWTGNGKDEA